MRHRQVTLAAIVVTVGIVLACVIFALYQM